jgi:hypothetical protein
MAAFGTVVRSILVFVFVVCACALVSQQQLMATAQTLRERLQQAPAHQRPASVTETIREAQAAYQREQEAQDDAWLSRGERMRKHLEPRLGYKVADAAASVVDVAERVGTTLSTSADGTVAQIGSALDGGLGALKQAATAATSLATSSSSSPPPTLVRSRVDGPRLNSWIDGSEQRSVVSDGSGRSGAWRVRRRERRPVELVRNDTVLTHGGGAAHSSTDGAPGGATGDVVQQCPGRRPYHIVMTAASGVYQEWQGRIMYYHYKKQRAVQPCSDLGGFTRLLNTRDARPDGLMDEIPTVLVRQLDGGRCDSCDHGFIVMNRPWGLKQFVAMPAYAAIEEDYLFLTEPDHLLLRPIPNHATPTTPLGFGFYYMTYKYDPPKLKPVISKYHDPDKVDPVGPSPVLISKTQLQGMVEPWWRLCIELKRDPKADKAFGWVLEMWGYALAAAKLGIRHRIIPELQAEPGGDGIREDELRRFYIYHYTFDLKTKRGGYFSKAYYEWSKRKFMGRYPTLLEEPPSSARASSRTFVSMMNEAMQAYGSDWKAKAQTLSPRGSRHG